MLNTSGDFFCGSHCVCLWSDAYFEAVRNVEFRRGDAHQIVHQHHDHDGDEHSKVTDGGAHLQKTNQIKERRINILFITIL